MSEDIQCGEKHTHKVNDNLNLFQIPNSLMDISFKICTINYIGGESPVDLIWDGQYLQPALARIHEDSFYMSFYQCNRGPGNTPTKRSGILDWSINPPGPTGQNDHIYCGGGWLTKRYYFEYGENPPADANRAMSFRYDNMGMDITQLCVFDEDVRDGAMTQVFASLQGVLSGGPGRAMVYYTTHGIPYLTGL